MGGSIAKWERTPLDPPHDRPLDVVGDVVVEVPLSGSEREIASMRHARDAEPNWRRAIGIAIIGGVVIGIAAAIVLLDDRSDADAEVETTLAPDELASRITTPPTLAPLTPLPTPDDPALDELDELDVGPQPTTSQEWTLFDSGPTPPRYPRAPVTASADDSDLSVYDVGAAVARLGDDVPRRSTTHLELGTGGFVLDVTITRDPINDRYKIVLESRGDQQVAIVDGATDTTYLDIGTDDRREVPNEEIISGSDAATINEYFDRLLLGPLRGDTIDDAAIDVGSLVTIDEVGVARQFDATIPGSVIPEWQLFAFSPVFEFPVEDRPSSLEYSVYVDQLGEVVQVDGVSLVGDVPQLVQHRLERLHPPEPVVLLTADPDAQSLD